MTSMLRFHWAHITNGIQSTQLDADVFATVIPQQPYAVWAIHTDDDTLASGSARTMPEAMEAAEGVWAE